MGKRKDRCDALLMALGQATRTCCDLAAENERLKAKIASHGECMKGLHDSHNQEHDELIAECAKLERERDMLKERVEQWETNSNKRCV